ncbi:RecBCD enzyme subunit RecB [Mycolicibacterium fallax]|nr:RecBCD enzyme subunit RecB [Mycolicibacterium fallax]
MNQSTELDPFDLWAELPAAGTTTVLEASAGTGKTYALAALVARYLAEGRATLDEMLLITFTRAATRELRERVRAQLLNAVEAFGRPESVTDDVLRRLVDVPAAEAEVRAKRLRDALAAFDDASVTTTHGFCQLVLRSLGVAGDSDSNVTLVENLDDLVSEITDDLYLAGFAHAEDRPVMTRADAGKLAKEVVAHPGVELRPADPAPGTPAAVRRDFAGKVLAELEIRKRRDRILSYDDLLSRLAGALQAGGADAARARMRSRWKVVLVDEFQDTDPIQWQVLESAFDGYAALILIGDPKQAIYAFRGADINTYLRAADGAAVRKTLNRNWRSDARLVASLQTLLGGAALGDPRIRVHPVDAQHPGSRLTGPSCEAPIRLRIADRDAVGVPPNKPLSIEVLRAHIAADLVGDVARMLAGGVRFDGSPLSAGDIAVITERNEDAVRCYEGLLAAGIPAVFTGDLDIFGTEAAADWLTLLEAFDQPDRTGVVRAAGATVFFGETAATLAAGGPELTDRLAETLREWADHARGRGIAAVLEAAQLAGMSQRLLGHTGGERSMTDLTQLSHLLSEAAHRDRLSLPGLRDWLRRRRTERDGMGERRRRLDSDADAVQVLTVWGSKGLQFPVVYLPYSFNRYLGEPDFPRYHDGDVRCLHIGGDSGPQRQQAVSAAQAETAGETLRVSYVALTRAQSQLVLWWAPSWNEPTGGVSRLVRGRRPGQSEVPAACLPMESDDVVPEAFAEWEAAGALVVEPSEIRAVEPVARERPSAELAVREFTRTLDTGWRRTSYSALLRAAEGVLPASGVGSEATDAGKDDETHTVDGGVAAGPSAVSEGALISPMAQVPAGAELGSLVHAVLEVADPAAADLTAELTAQVRAQQKWWPVAVSAEELGAALLPMHDTPLGPLAGGLTLRNIGHRDRLCELDFEIPLAGGDGCADAPRITVARIGELLAARLSPDDPLVGYAERLMTPELGGQPLRGYLSGSIDVVLRVPGRRYLIVDYKTNKLGDPARPLTSADYGQSQLVAAMEHSHYPLQALLYSVVLHRFLRWRQPNYDPDRHLGGVLYLFLRGMCGPETPAVDGVPAGVFSWAPPAKLIVELSDLLAAQEVRA